jgi:AraC-like DNA-binding protein
VGPLASLHRRLTPTYDVRTVPTVCVAHSALRTHAPHFVLSAAELVDGAGAAVVAAVDRLPPGERPPVVVLSATDREPFLEATAVALAAAARFHPSPDRVSDDAFGTLVVSAAYGRLGDPAFGPEELAVAVGLSPRQLRRRLAALIGEAPGDLLRRLRLKRAAELLRAGARVAEAGHAVGVGGPSTFRAAFRRRFGVAPSTHARAQRTRPPPPRPTSDIGRLLSDPERLSGDDAPDGSSG